MLNRILNKQKQIRVLLIEDQYGDIMMFQRTLQRAGSNFVITSITDGKIAYDMFAPDNVLQQVPHIIILDLNLPRVSGLQILQRIRQHSIYKNIPVIILTTSKRQMEVKLAYLNNATTYFAKPNNPEDVKQLIQIINKYWGQFAQLYDFNKDRKL